MIQSAYIVLQGFFLPVKDPRKLGSISFADGSTMMNIDENPLGYEYGRNEFRMRHVEVPSQEFGLFHLCTMTDSFGSLPLKDASLLFIESAGDGRSYKRIEFHTERPGGSIGGHYDKHSGDFKAAAWIRRKIRLI